MRALWCARGGQAKTTSWLVGGQVACTEETAAVRGVTPQTVEAYQAAYATTGESAALVNRRHSSAGQQTAYRIGPHKPRLVRQATLNLLQGQQNSGRRLAEQLGHAVDDRTVDRHLDEMGGRAVQEAGLREEVAA